MIENKLAMMQSQVDAIKSDYESYILSHCCCKWDGDEIISVCDRHAAMTNQLEAAQKEIVRLQDVISQRNRSALDLECRCQVAEEKLSTDSAASGQVMGDLQAAYQELQEKHHKTLLCNAELGISNVELRGKLADAERVLMLCKDAGVLLAVAYFAAKEGK